VRGLIFRGGKLPAAFVRDAGRGEEKRGRERRTKREIGDRKRAERKENLEKESWLALRRERKSKGENDEN